MLQSNRYFSKNVRGKGVPVIQEAALSSERLHFGRVAHDSNGSITLEDLAAGEAASHHQAMIHTHVGLCLYAASLWEGTANAAVRVLLCHCQLSQLLSAKKTNYDVEALISYIYY